MMNFEQDSGYLVGSITSLKGRTNHFGEVHVQIMDD
jgi:hypothetical protein